MIIPFSVPDGNSLRRIFCLVQNQMDSRRGLPVPMFCALCTVLDIATRLVGTDPIYLTVRNFLTLCLYGGSIGRSETNFKLAVEMVPTADNARRYAEDIAANSPTNIQCFELRRRS